MEKQHSRRWWVLIGLAIGLLAVGLDMTILNLALPTLSTELQASSSDLQWFADAYMLVFAAALLPAGLLGDRLGRKKMLFIGLLLFGAASIVCAYAETSTTLIIGRAMLGLGAALLVPLSMSLIPILFAEEERSKAIGVWVMANAIGIPLGPIAGGWLLNHYHWSSVFWINIPFVVIAFVIIALLLKESHGENSVRTDYVGMLLSSLGLVGITYGLIEAGEGGWGNAEALLSIGAGVVLLAGFVWWIRRCQAPLVDPGLFRSAVFTWGSVMATIISFIMFGLLFVLPQFFQGVQGTDAFGAGLRLLPLVGGLIIGSKAADAIQHKTGAWAAMACGFVLLGVSLAIGANMPISDGFGLTAVWITISGFGIGLVLPAAMDMALSSLTAERSGVGSALIMALRNIGGTIGVAVLGTVLSRSYRGTLDVNGLPEQAAEAVQRNVAAGAAIARQLDSLPLLMQVQDAFVLGMSRLLWICGGIAAAGLLLAVLFLRKVKERASAGQQVDI
ncbi:DHA2 family efflux MFS transporter permease subunit [Paenibacillus sp. 1011MAR3C5]|uniref:DHA2 family efflux MFS transporter permease subunit n=1 Tax=Paenibacillus sp. 1011MAR3C5 TaxID=1675787 RepID=UPI000E6BB88D|nr:DHA2 family efflux MFS transporter permease subunit [Paenibacillus sp. 1011MAR3C5]RJE87451.1 DHA2 family efflux MFS transporter permease subunit [Paenibacillus sp. 1011MAR3C5]